MSDDFMRMKSQLPSKQLYQDCKVPQRYLSQKMWEVIENKNELKKHINALYNQEQKDKKNNQNNQNIVQNQKDPFAQSIMGNDNQLLRNQTLAPDQVDVFQKEAIQPLQNKDDLQKNENSPTNIEYLSKLKSSIKTFSIEEKICDFSNCLCVSTDQEIFYFNDNDKHIYKINYNKDVIDKRSLEKKDNKNSIGNAKKLLLTSPDNKYLVLGTTSGFVFVIQTENFEFECRFKIDEQVEQIYYTMDKNDYNFYIQDSKNLYCITNKKVNYIQTSVDKPIPPIKPQNPRIEEPAAPKSPFLTIEGPKAQTEKQKPRRPSIQPQNKSDNPPADFFISFNNVYTPKLTIQRFQTARSQDMDDEDKTKIQYQLAENKAHRISNDPDFFSSYRSIKNDGQSIISQQAPNQDQLENDGSGDSIMSQQDPNKQNNQIQQNLAPNQNLQVLYNNEDESEESLLDNQYESNNDDNGSENNKVLSLPKDNGSPKSDQSILSQQVPDQQNEKKDNSDESGRSIMSQQDPYQQNDQIQQNIVLNQSSSGPYDFEKEGGSEESQKSILDNQFNPQVNDSQSDKKSNDAERVKKAIEIQQDQIITERKQLIEQHSPTKTSSYLVSMQQMPFQIQKIDTPRRQPYIETEFVDIDIEFPAQDQYKLYSIYKQEDQTQLELKSLKMTNSLQMIVLEKIKTDQNIVEHFFTFYDINDLEYKKIQSKDCFLIKEKFRIPLSQVRDFSPKEKVILELSRDEKKLYFNSTILKIEGKIQNGIYEVCADVNELKKKKQNLEKIEIKEYLNINQQIVEEIIPLSDDKTIITLSRSDTSGPLKITDLITKQTKVLEFQQFLKQFEEKSLQNSKEEIKNQVVIESMAITQDEKLLYLIYFSTRIKQSLILCYDLENKNLIMQLELAGDKKDSEKLQIMQDLLILTYKKKARQPTFIQFFKIINQSQNLEKNEMINISPDKKYTFKVRKGIYQLLNNQTKKITSFGMSIIPKTFTKDSQELIIFNQNKKIMNKINLEEFEISKENNMEHICEIKDGRFEGMTQVDDDKQFCYYMSEKGSLYQINYQALNQIVETLEFPKGATFMLSRSKHQKYILVSYKDNLKANIIQKVIIDQKTQKMYLENDKKIVHKLYQTRSQQSSMSNFDNESRVFITGGNQSENLGVFNPKNMQQLFILEGHKEKGISNCFFIKNEHNENENIVLTFTHNEMICWYVQNIFEHWIKLYTVNEHIKPITGYNNQLTGLRIGDKFKIWDNRLLYEFSDNRHKFIHYYENECQRNKLQPKETWISGPNPETFHERFQVFKTLCNSNQSECEKMLHTLVHNVVEPAGYTVLSWLASGGWTEYLRKALSMKPRYIRDKEGMTPLMYSLKIRNHEQVNLIMQFLVQDDRLMNQIDFSELQKLIVFSPPGIEDFLNRSVSELDIGEKLGELQDQSSKKFIFQKEIRTDRIYDQLCLQKSSMNQDLQQSVVFKCSRLHLTMLPGSIESMQFHLALQNCQKKIFNTELIKNYIECKWQRVKWVAYVLTLMQIFNTILINFHLFNPGWKKNLFMLILVALWFVAIEVFIYFASGKNFINISYLTIVLSGLTVIYSMFILFFGHNSYNNYLLPIINLLSWFKLVEDLRFSESIRIFVSLLRKSIKSLKGFFIFLILMLFMFASSLTIIKRNEVRDRIINMSKGDDSYEIDLFIRNNLLKNWSEHVSDYADSFYSIMMMLYGEIQDDFGQNDLEIKQSTFLKIFQIVASFILLTILMNIIVSLMNETYGQQMSEKEQSDGSEKNKLIYLLETFIVWARFAGEPSYFVWAEYKDQPITEEKSQTCQILYNIGQVNANINNQLNNKVLYLQEKMDQNQVQHNAAMKLMENQIKELRSELQIKLDHQKVNQDSQHQEIMEILRKKLA